MSSTHQSSAKYFTLVLGQELKKHDFEAFEEIMHFANISAPEGVANAKIIEADICEQKIKEFLDTPAKHRKEFTLDLPILRFDLELDTIWDPKLSLKPFNLDYLDGPTGYRVARAESDSSPLRKALPRARDTSNKILWDLCGGWRVDALMMSHWGFHVHSFEKSPWVHLLSKRALDRSRLIPEKELPLELHLQDATEALDSLPLTQKLPPSVIYIDPMFPETNSKALNQVDMRYLHHLSYPEDNALELLKHSLNLALDKVIIKRPHKTPYLLQKPHQQIEQGSTRYDIYLSQH